MEIRTPLAKHVGSALFATFALQLLAADAMAAKAQFERNKPHVNVGSSASDGSQGTGNLVTPQGSASGMATPSGTGSGEDCKPDPSKPAGSSPC